MDHICGGCDSNEISYPCSTKEYENQDCKKNKCYNKKNDCYNVSKSCKCRQPCQANIKGGCPNQNPYIKDGHNNKYPSCPAIMSDGRAITNYNTKGCGGFNYGKLTGASDYRCQREILQKNGGKKIELNNIKCLLEKIVVLVKMMFYEMLGE